MAEVKPAGGGFDPASAAKEASGEGSAPKASSPGMGYDNKLARALLSESPHEEPIEAVDPPSGIAENWRRYAWRGTQKVLGVAGRAAIVDYALAAAGFALASFKSEGEAGESGGESGGDEEPGIPVEDLPGP